MKLFRSLAVAAIALAALPATANAADPIPNWDGNIPAWVDGFLGIDLSDLESFLPTEEQITELLPSDECIDAVIDWALGTAGEINWDEVTLETLPDLIDRIWLDAVETLGPLCPLPDAAPTSDPQPVDSTLFQTTDTPRSTPLRRNDDNGRPNRDEAKFDAADADNDGILTLDEFADTESRNKPLVEVRRKFLRADADASGGVTLAEWIAYKNDGGPDDNMNRDKFALADLNDDGFLTLSEFAGTRSPNSNPTAVAKKFDKLDKDDSGRLTRAEFNGRPDPV